MSADYFNSPLAPMSCSGAAEKWYEVARSREKRLFRKVDVFMYLFKNQNDTFDLLYVAFDEINRRFTKCYRGKFVVKTKNNYLIIRKGLLRKRFFIVAYDDVSGMVALSNKRKSKCWILSKNLPYDKISFENIMRSLKNNGFNLENIELFYY